MPGFASDALRRLAALTLSFPIHSLPTTTHSRSFGTCYFKRVRRNDGTPDGLLAPLLPEVARNFLWRNSLVTDGELEWMCIICGFDNKPRSEYCSMCGTSHSFTLEYKSEKKEEKARAKREKEAARQQRKSKKDADSTPPRPSLLRDDGTGEAQYSPLAATGTAGGDSKLDAAALHKLLSSNSDASNNGPLLLEEVEEGGLTWRPSLQREDAVLAAASGVGAAAGGPVTSRLSFSSPSRQSASAISFAQRQEAFNYRRLNQLSLRQKSARRRKMWQRVVGPDGSLQWVRVSPHETLVGDAQFGYTPRNSLLGRDDSDAGSQSDAGGAGSGTGFSFLGVFGLGGSSRRAQSGDRQRSEGEASEDSRASFDAAAMSGGGGGGGAGGYRPAPIVDADTEAPASSSGGGGAGAQPIPIGSGRGGTDAASLLAKHVGGSRRRRGTTRPGPALSSDSFGDSVVLSGSPGFTTVFTEDSEAGPGGGWGLQWERVESGATARRSTLPAPEGGRQSSVSQAASASAPMRTSSTATAAAGGGFGAGGAVGGEATLALPDEDLVSVAALPFKEKQLWFLQQMGRLQRPWNDGCVRLEVRRGDHLLQDSVRQFADLPRADLHKWIRVQFAGEPGIDAGGLEREWFSLAVQELFQSRTGLFTCSSGDALGGTYHINPTSGASQPEHLRFFRFAGKLCGKALMEQQMVAATLSLPLRKQILGLPITFSDLEFVDPQLHRNLRWLDTCPDLSALCLDFTVTYPGAAGAETFELKPNGADCGVSNANKEEYLLLRLRNRMLDSVKPQLEALLRGLYEVVPPDLLSVFDYPELELLMCGVPEISLEDWMRHTDYLSDYSRQGARHRVIRWFWKAVEAMGREERVRLLQFTTGCSRLPAQGFKALQSNDGNYRRFNIQAISKRVSRPLLLPLPVFVCCLCLCLCLLLRCATGKGLNSYNTIFRVLPPG